MAYYHTNEMSVGRNVVQEIALNPKNQILRLNIIPFNGLIDDDDIINCR